MNETTQSTYNIIYNWTNYIKNNIIQIVYFAYSISKIYALWIILHYFASHLYVKLCVPQSMIGFVLSPFLSPAPHCQGLRWVIYNGGNMIDNMWFLLGSWICSTILMVHLKKI